MSTLRSPSHTPDAQSLPLPVGVVLSVLTGLLIPIQSRINGGLSAALGDPQAAAIVNNGVGLVIIVVLVISSPVGRRGLGRWWRALRGRTLPWWSVFAGACGAMFVLAQTSTVNIIGVAIFTIALVSGQTVSGLVIDRIGLGPSGRHPLTGVRVAGAVGVLIAVTIAVMGRPDAGVGTIATLLPVLAPLLAGLLLGFQHAMNGRVAVTAGTPLVATTVNFAVGGVVLLTIWLIALPWTGLPAAPPTDWWLYLGGAFGIAFVGCAAWLVRHIGVLLLGLGTIAGQLIGALVLDLMVPTPGSVVQATTVIGTLLTLVAVGVASMPWRTPRQLEDPESRRTR